MPPSQLGAFAKSDANQSSANIEWHVRPCRWRNLETHYINLMQSPRQSATFVPPAGAK